MFELAGIGDHMMCLRPKNRQGMVGSTLKEVALGATEAQSFVGNI
jgi:hypothetical protein